MFKEAADLGATLGHYQKAIQRYEQVRKIDICLCFMLMQSSKHRSPLQAYRVL